MHLFAIAIYKRLESGRLERLAFSQHNKSLFASNELEKLEKQSFTHLPIKLAKHGMYHIKNDDEYHYIQARDDVILAISSRNKLEITECTYLFNNMYHIHIRPNTVKTKLDDILSNPLGFIGRDLLLGCISEQLADLKIIMLTNIDKVIERGVKIETLKDKSIELEINAKKFRKSIPKNSHCCW